LNTGIHPYWVHLDPPAPADVEHRGPDLLLARIGRAFDELDAQVRTAQHPDAGGFARASTFANARNPPS